MSGTIKAGVIQHPDSVSANLTLNDDGTVEVPELSAGLVYGGNLRGSNLLQNGAMQVAQRGVAPASAVGITSASTAYYYTADRWRLSIIGTGSLGTWTQTVESDAPTGSGFRNSLKMLITADADATPDNDDLVQIQQRIEGQNLQSVKKGTSSAEPLTLSFWVKSNKTGTYIAELIDADNSNRHVSAAYTIDSSATWERKTVTFPADTSGAFDNDNANSLSLNFTLASGSNYTSGTLATTWQALDHTDRAVGQTNLASDVSNYWQVTGVQLEVGSAATGFEFKDYAAELAECQRYYEKSYNADAAPGTNTAVGMTGASITGLGANNVYVPVQFRVTKRATPTINSYSISGTIDCFSNVRASPIDEPSGSVASIVWKAIGANGASAVNVTTPSEHVYFHWVATADL